MAHVGKAIAESLEAHGVSRTFIIPGESFLPVLDGIYDSSIHIVVCRQEGGAGYMAEAHAKATGEPGVVMVTRGPGAANAFVAVHTAWQDATPLVLFIGLIPLKDRDRESFQEFDPKAWFGTQAKQVFVIDDPASASRVVADAFFLARSGRPGPVIVGLPEDILYKEFSGISYPPVPVSEGAVSAAQLARVRERLAAAKRPVIFAGGPGWDAQASEALAAFATKNRIPVVHNFRTSDRIPYSSPANAGWLGVGRSDATAELVDNADVVIQLGNLLTDAPSDGFTLRQGTDQVNIAVTMDTELRGKSGVITEHIVATPRQFIAELTSSGDLEGANARQEFFDRAHVEHLDYGEVIGKPWRPTPENTVHLEEVFAQLHKQVGEDGVFTYGAGNHCMWVQRYVRTERYPSLLGVGNGSMGYSIPAATAAALEFPDRTVVTIAGDGEYLMNGQELATAVQEGVAFLVVTVSNGQYATIRDHQESHFPGRISGTQMDNPDFAEVARSFGAYGELVTEDSQVAGAIERALRVVRKDKVPALVNVIIDQDLSAPS
ncbi:thiamine pyrophosphate-dependent enzyme [Corynebacterium mayonis]|uniref:thiamine pyrophosphate-dependent enzyme n=1 Tax=Corynebacterium mayonis TaxID=3062461 RepID=UPI0031409B4A